MEIQQRVLLCTECEACAAVELSDEGVKIGEEGNLVWLKKQEWNRLVELIKKGVLREL